MAPCIRTPFVQEATKNLVHCSCEDVLLHTKLLPASQHPTDTALIPDKTNHIKLAVELQRLEPSKHEHKLEHLSPSADSIYNKNKCITLSQILIFLSAEASLSISQSLGTSLDHNLTQHVFSPHNIPTQPGPAAHPLQKKPHP